MQTKNKKNILLTQSFIMDKPGSYWDYRDYVFSLCSNKTFKDQPVRLNVERGVEWIDELEKSAQHAGFNDCRITGVQPKSWADYMTEQIKTNPTTWTMPFPGDHIYIEEDETLFEKYLTIGEEKKVEAISFGHIQDWDYFLDWKRIEVIENTEDYVIIKWGNKYRHCKNYDFIKKAQKTIDVFLTMPPVPGFMIYKSDLFLDILKEIPKSNRWQDMEYVDCQETWSYKVLLPKQYLYRHVHGYWAEYFFDVINAKKQFDQDRKKALDTMYLRTNYDWRKDSPKNVVYGKTCLEKNMTMLKYIERNPVVLPKVYSPFFNADFRVKKSVCISAYHMFLLSIDRLKNFANKIRIILKKKI